MKTSKSSKLSAFLIIVLMMFMAPCLTSCDGYTWKYHTTIQYHYEGEDIIHTTEHDVSFGYNSSIKEIVVHAFANSFDDGHRVELVYVVHHNGTIQPAQGARESHYVYGIMHVPDKSVVIDNVKTVRTSKTK